MSGTIFLIVEGKMDELIVKALIKRRYPHVKVDVRQPGPIGGIDRLAEKIDELIQQAIKDKKEGDCIAVLHDADLHTRLTLKDRASHLKIEKVCEHYKAHVVRIVAYDTIEAWLLADSGLCQWLGIKVKNCDRVSQPKDELIRLLNKKSGVKYVEHKLPQILTHLDGTKTASESLKKALKHLIDAPCVSEE